MGNMDKIKKPFGFSSFPYELACAPKSWAEATGKVTFFKSHDKVISLALSLWKMIDNSLFRVVTLRPWRCLMFFGRTLWSSLIMQKPQGSDEKRFQDFTETRDIDRWKETLVQRFYVHPQDGIDSHRMFSPAP